MQLREITDRDTWDGFVTQAKGGHPLQLWGWGEAKRSTNWTPYRLALMDGEMIVAGTQVLLWPIPRLGKKIAYVPRGPVAEPDSKAAHELLTELVAWAKSHGVLYLRVEPAWTKGKLPKGWQKSAHNIQLPETYTIDLGKSEDELLEPMARKHRQYIRKAERDGVTVERDQVLKLASGQLDSRPGLAAMYEIYSETAARAGFGIHAEEYYADLFGQLGQQGYLYYARFEGRPVAFLWLAAAGSTAYELYGGVNAEGQEIKANYYLKWQAMTELKTAGYTIYDFNGRLNEGVSRFKDGFGPDPTDYIGTWDYPINKFGYQMWERLWPVAKPIGRRIIRLTKGL